ncbi:hypothetical protein [Aeromonas salmonicida]|uniref:hypothetical protein n=1 Tax=Aeromonas salmonicida TaxID=645 RepID=UPI00223EF71D|nr:hypothetical protein [Aeromonas salmonicida]
MQAQSSTDVVATQMDAAIHCILQELSKLFMRSATAFKEWPGEIRPAISSLANLGWFPSGKMGLSEIHSFRALCDSGNKSIVAAAMIEWLHEEQNQIQERASIRFPNRSKILASAFNAHSTGQYELSVPIFMAQVEGMCLEVVGTKLFSMKKGLPATRAATEKFCQMALSDALLLPFREPNGFTASEAERHQWPDTPNRHEVLHGIATDYGTRENSFKTISLLEYFITFVAPRFNRN